MDFALNKIFTIIRNHINRHQNLTTLKRKLEELNALKEDNESKKSVELQPRKKLKKEVALWFRDVERIKGEILIDPENEVGPSNPLLRKILRPNIILKRIQEVEELLQRGKSYGGLVIDNPQWIGQVLSTTNLVGEAAKNSMKELWAYLMDDHVSRIGVWGMGGVGKTTIMKLMNNQLLQEPKKFDTVMWITVSKELNIAKLQGHIARAMKVSLFDDDVTRRAGMLYEMLSRKHKYVLILDDLWDNLSLEEVGIPETSTGSKLVITTRLMHVCHSLDCQVVRMPILPEQDARSLFFQKLGEDIVNYPQLLPIVESVVEQCAGLPLAIVTVASSMKGISDIHEWRNAFSELSKHAKCANRLDEKVLRQLQFSYDRLEDEKVKQCFLCCALWPEDSEIFTTKLIELWIAEGLVGELESMQEEIDRGHTILNKLINSCLLENTEKSSRSYVKLHDLVRDMTLHITSGKPRFLVRAGMQLKEIPDLKEWAEDLEKVSLMKNSGIQIPAQMSPPKCQMLTTLLLPSCYITSIPECFFEQMHGLKILDLSWNHIKSLPKSISDLENLTTLLLFECVNLENMPSFSKLQALKKLNLEATKIKNLPRGMERLINLKYLNLSHKGIANLPDGILSNFSLLQHLVVDKRFERCQTFVRGDEIGGLRMLEIFAGRFYGLEELSNYVQALHGKTPGPREYYICVGGKKLHYHFNYEKCIELHDCQIYRNGVNVPSNIQQLNVITCSFEFWKQEPIFSWFTPVSDGIFSTLTEINLSFCKKIKKLFSSDWVLKNLQNLEVLKVWWCDEMEEIIASASALVEEGMDTSNTLNLALPKLRELSLCSLPELKSIYSAKGAMVCDSLQTVKIDHCPKLKRIPLYLPLLEEGRPSPPPCLQQIKIYPTELWEDMEWDHPNADSALEPFVVDFAGNKVFV